MSLQAKELWCKLDSNEKQISISRILSHEEKDDVLGSISVTDFYKFNLRCIYTVHLHTEGLVSDSLVSS